MKKELFFSLEHKKTAEKGFILSVTALALGIAALLALIASYFVITYALENSLFISDEVKEQQEKDKRLLEEFERIKQNPPTWQVPFEENPDERLTNPLDPDNQPTQTIEPDRPDSTELVVPDKPAVVCNPLWSEGPIKKGEFLYCISAERPCPAFCTYNVFSLKGKLIKSTQHCLDVPNSKSSSPMCSELGI